MQGERVEEVDAVSAAHSMKLPHGVFTPGIPLVERSTMQKNETSSAIFCRNFLIAPPKVSELRRQEGMDPPIPAHVTDILDAAEGDLRLLNWKYAVLLTATAKRTNASTRGVNPAAAVETAKGSSLSEEDVIALLSEHVSFSTMFKSTCVANASTPEELFGQCPGREGL